MTRFTPNTNRFDPHKNFKFRVKFDGRVVAGITEVSGLPVTEVSKRKNHKTKQPGLTKYTNITLKRGVSNDTDFFNWVNNVSGKNHKNITIELFDKSGKLVLSYLLANSWPSKISAPDFNADSNEVAIESIELTHEGIEITQC